MKTDICDFLFTSIITVTTKNKTEWINNLFSIAEFDRDKLVDRKFCNFKSSNRLNSDPVRDLFCRELSKYKKVDSAGRHLNNIGGSVKNKMGFSAIINSPSLSKTAVYRVIPKKRYSIQC